MKLSLKLAASVAFGICVLCIGPDPMLVVADQVAEEQGSAGTRKLAAEKPSTARVKAFMRKKLVAADQIMEGLTKPDARLIRQGAISMIHMSKEAMWASHNSPSYAQDSADLVRAAERLIKLSKANDLEGASHTYAQLTIQCVNCHRRVRGPQVAWNALTPSKVKLAATKLDRAGRTPLFAGK